jgi:hypothetical protein
MITMAAPLPQAQMTTYAVTYTVTAEKFDNDRRMASKVVLFEGYSDFEDIRKMLAVKKGVSPTDIKILAILIED